jgi:putative hydrolase of the HAD superfamily
MTLKAAIFDRDGVLAYFDFKAASQFFRPLLPISLDRLNQHWQQWGAEVGFPSTLVQEKVFWQGFWHWLGDQFNLPSSIQNRLQDMDYTRFFRPFPDARSALVTARQHGLRVGVLSNFSLASLEDTLMAIGLADLVDVAAAATVIGASKPEPDAYLSVTKALGVQPQQCLFFDDEEICVTGARTLGMHSYRVNRDYTNHDLSQNTVCDLSALSAILASLDRADESRS